MQNFSSFCAESSSHEAWECTESLESNYVEGIVARKMPMELILWDLWGEDKCPFDRWTEELLCEVIVKCNDKALRLASVFPRRRSLWAAKEITQRCLSNSNIARPYVISRCDHHFIIFMPLFMTLPKIPPSLIILAKIRWKRSWSQRMDKKEYLLHDIYLSKC